MKKKAEDLKPGDVIAGDSSSFGGRIVVDAFPATDIHDNRIVVDAFGQKRREVDRYWIDPDTEVEVESPSLTPAQQHAEELLEWSRKLHRCAADGKANSDYMSFKDSDALTALLAKIDPPKPPSAEELARALAELESHSRVCGAFNHAGKVIGDNAVSILERARAAGMLATRTEEKA